MAIFDWLKKKEPEDYEQVLASLALDIQNRQARLSEIRQRERRTTLLITMYTFAIWAAYVGAWYAGWRPLKAFPILAGPIIIQFARRIAQAWYERIGNAEEKTLKELLSQQRSKVEEIKKKTNYYSTKNLIERYDSASSGGSPGRPRPEGPSGQPQLTPQKAPTNPQGAALGQPNGFAQPNRGQPPNMPVLGAQIPQGPPVPPRKQWFDRLADALLGDDELGTEAARTRYALICQRCFAHNGLVKQELWEDTQYVCPKCGHFNPSMRALKAGHAGPGSPTRASAVTQYQAQPVWQAQRRAAPRLSAPLSSSVPLLHAEETDINRRRSLPAPDLGAIEDDGEQQGHADSRTKTRRSPLAQSVPLPSDDDEDGYDAREEGEEEEEQGPRRRRRLVTVDELVNS